MARTHGTLGLTAALLAGFAGVAGAQDGGAPLSAIDWLSRSVETPAVAAAGPRPGLRPPLPGEPPVSQDATAPDVSVAPLDAVSPDAIGLLPPEVTGLPRSLWSGSSVDLLTDLIHAERVETLPALQELIITLMLVEADPPMGATPDGRMFLARIDKLLDLGALDQALALLDEAGPDSPALFRRWFDVSLLTGTEQEACTLLRSKPEFAPTYQARIFCLARNGQFDAAVLVLNTGEALGDISPEEDALLARFLDPDLFEGEGPLPPPSRPSPLVFAMREAIGERLSTGTLPRAFAHADLRDTAGWRNQMEAAERLARVGAVDPNRLQALYTERTPAASGGVWDRAAAFQQFDRAVSAQDASAVARTLPEAFAAMETARIEIPFAQLYSAQLATVDLTGEAAALAFRVRLLSSAYESAALSYRPTNAEDRFLAGVARGTAELSDAPNTPAGRAVAEAFSGHPAPDALATLARNGRLGEAILRAIALISEGTSGDPVAVRDGLSFFRSVGMEDLARRTALQYLILDRAP